MRPDEVVEALRGRFGAAVLGSFSDRGQVGVWLDRARVVEALRYLRDEAGYCFPTDATAVDYTDWPEPDEAPERFAVVYHLARPGSEDLIRLKVPVSEHEPEVPSGVSVFPALNWLEREIFDMFGIRFAGHPDLRRILCPEENMRGHPLRKDYPLRGRGERANFRRYTVETQES